MEQATQAEIAYNKIRDAIKEGRLLPGQKLPRREMARLSKVSVIPVIEALHRLENDGLVTSQPHFGSSVVRFDDEQFESYAILREAVECQVARELCGKLQAADEVALREMAAELDQHLYRSSDTDEHSLWDLHHQFHSKMAELTQCQPLIGTLKKINLFNFLKQVVEKNKNKESLPDNWHMRLVDAIANDDQAAAESVFREHVQSSRIKLKEHK